MSYSLCPRLSGLSFVYVNSHHYHDTCTQMLHFREAVLIAPFKIEFLLPLFSPVLSVNFPVFLPCVYGPSISHRINLRIHYNKDLSIVHTVAPSTVHSNCYSVKKKVKKETIKIVRVGKWSECSDLKYSKWVSEVVQSFLTLRPHELLVHQAPPSMGFSRQEYWSGLPFPPPGDLPNPEIELGSPTLQTDALTYEPPGKPKVFKCIKKNHQPSKEKFMKSCKI